MKTITIGRGDGANIIIDDEMISRRHAILRIYTFGKMELVDMGKNGTYVNGVKLRPNVPFPVKRKDVVNFAEVSKLDWSMVPDNTKYFKIGAIILAAIITLLILIGIGTFCYNTFIADKPTPTEYQDGGAQQGDKPTPVKTESRIEDPEEKAKQQKDKTEEGKKDLSGKRVQDLYPSAPKKEEPAKGKKSKDKGKKQDKQEPETKKEEVIL